MSDGQQLPPGWIQMRSGARVWPFDEAAVGAGGGSEFRIADIAWNLGHKCRFNGSLGWYSVAEHCVRMCRAYLGTLGGCCGDRETARDEYLKAMALLMHDAAEAVTFDCPRPIKGSVLVDYRITGMMAARLTFREAEIRIHARIMRALLGKDARGFIDGSLDDFVGGWDLRMLRTEAELLCPHWMEWPEIQGIEAIEGVFDLDEWDETDNGWSPDDAALLFTREFAELCKGLGMEAVQA